MSVDPRVIDALKEAVLESGQPEALARKLGAWLTSVTGGNEDLNDRDAADRHLELIYGEVNLSEEGEAEEDAALDMDGGGD